MAARRSRRVRSSQPKPSVTTAAPAGPASLGATRDLALAEALDRHQLQLARAPLGTGRDRRHEGRLARRAAAPLAAGAHPAAIGVVQQTRPVSGVSASRRDHRHDLVLRVAQAVGCLTPRGGRVPPTRCRSSPSRSGEWLQPELQRQLGRVEDRARRWLQAMSSSRDGPCIDEPRRGPPCLQPARPHAGGTKPSGFSAPAASWALIEHRTEGLLPAAPRPRRRSAAGAPRDCSSVPKASRNASSQTTHARCNLCQRRSKSTPLAGVKMPLDAIQPSVGGCPGSHRREALALREAKQRGRCLWAHRVNHGLGCQVFGGFRRFWLWLRR